MRHTRVVPVLLLMNRGLYKTVQFKNPIYIGDPINAVKIFNDKGVDELIVLDINASKNKIDPDFEYLGMFAEECFVPLCYGGGIKNEKHAENILKIGFEKISINSAALEDIEFAERVVKEFGSQSIVGSIDIKRNIFGVPSVFHPHVDRKIKISDPISFAKTLTESGLGELLINSVDNEGLGIGYDLRVIKDIANSVNVPVIACGGADNLQHLAEAVEVGASAVAGSKMFVFHGKHKAVLISYPDESELDNILP